MAELSKCCNAEAATVINDDNLGLCAKCNNWISFYNTNPNDEEENDNALLSKALSVVRFYANPTMYQQGVEPTGKIIEQDAGKTARDFLRKENLFQG